MEDPRLDASSQGRGSNGPEPHRLPLWRLGLSVLRRLPQGAVSRALGGLAEVRLPGPLRGPLVGAAARILGIDLAEAERPARDYPSLAALFVRELRPGSRPVASVPAVTVSPVDGVLGECGIVRSGRVFQVKGRPYSLARLLDDTAAAGAFEGGTFVTIYLSPRHYHRIHSPCDGGIVAARHVPGALMPVNPPALYLVPELFPRNERLVCHIEGPLGRVAVVAVGAFNVGRISAAFDPAWNQPTGGVTNRRRAEATTHRYEPPVAVARGEEIMAFRLGSTVVLAFEPGRVTLPESLFPGAELRMGQALGF